MKLSEEQGRRTEKNIVYTFCRIIFTANLMGIALTVSEIMEQETKEGRKSDGQKEKIRGKERNLNCITQITTEVERKEGIKKKRPDRQIENMPRKIDR